MKSHPTAPVESLLWCSLLTGRSSSPPTLHSSAVGSDAPIEPTQTPSAIIRPLAQPSPTRPAAHRGPCCSVRSRYPNQALARPSQMPPPHPSHKLQAAAQRSCPAIVSFPDSAPNPSYELPVSADAAAPGAGPSPSTNRTAPAVAGYDALPQCPEKHSAVLRTPSHPAATAGPEETPASCSSRCFRPSPALYRSMPD